MTETASLNKLVRAHSSKLAALLTRLVPNRPNEAEFRQPVDQLLSEFCAAAGLDPLRRLEYTLGTGRADAVFNRFIVEYKEPGTLGPHLAHRGTKQAVQQVEEYIRGVARRQRQEITRIAGVAFDGKYLVFVRYREGAFTTEAPAPVGRESLERFLYWLASLSSGIALTAENLNRDFSIDQLRTQTALRALTQGVAEAVAREPAGMVGKLFDQWRLFFSESIDYTEAFGGRKLDSLKAWVRRAGLAVRTAAEAERFFFALHTYFALLVKFLAWLALSRHLAVKIGVPSFGELLGADSDTLRRRLQEMESGGIFRAYGIDNLLEGDFFAWYLYAWNSRIEEALRQVLQRLDDYDPATLSIVPEETRDLFKKLYHYLLPREIRHNLGEYYTPDWLAKRLLTQVDAEFFTADPRQANRRLREKLLQARWLDPACGSGTFLVLIIARMRELGDALMVSETDLLNAILTNVVGFDLNPLAVLTARVNYLLAVSDLLAHRKSDVTIPVYLADSVRTPGLGRDLFAAGAYEFPTAVGKLLVPAPLCTRERFDRFCQVLEESIRSEIETASFVSRVQRECRVAPTELDGQATARLTELYELLRSYHRRGLNGLWARLLRNNFAPLAVGEFDYVVGNPPWVNWEHLPDGYRDDIKPIWQRYGLFPHSGMDTILGRGKKDIAMLMTYAVADGALKDGGRLGFVITQSVFKTSGAGQGFRRFRIPRPGGKDVPLEVVHVDDLVGLNPFEGASNRTAAMVLRKGRSTRYPVPYTVWRKERGARLTYDSTLEEVTAATRRVNFQAEPVDKSDVTSPWLTAGPKALKALRKVLGRSDYGAHEGCNTGGANAVYWLEEVMKRPDGLVVVRNITEGARVQINESVEPLEPDLLYPLLRGRDVQRWYAEPSASILMVQDPVRRRGISEREVQTNYSHAYQYLKHFEKELRNRAAFKRYFTRKERNGRLLETGPFYSMFNVGTYTFAPWKVVWREVSHTLDAAVAGPTSGKPTVPDHTLILVDCREEGEAHYLCATLNSSPARLAVQAYIVLHPDPHILERVRIPRYDPEDPVHRSLADLSRRAHQAARQSDRTTLAQIEQEIDRQAARLWGLTDAELKDIQASLRELAGDE